MNRTKTRDFPAYILDFPKRKSHNKKETPVGISKQSLYLILQPKKLKNHGKVHFSFDLQEKQCRDLMKDVKDTRQISIEIKKYYKIKKIRKMY